MVSVMPSVGEKKKWLDWTQILQFKLSGTTFLTFTLINQQIEENDIFLR